MVAWDDVKRVFDEVLEVDPSQRDAYLRTACEGAPDLLGEVQSLLEWSEASGSFLESPIARVADLPISQRHSDSLVGQQLGVWRIVEVIGRGGMGVVYKAERADAAFRRAAALKVVQHGPRSSDIVERFRRERETLAALDHPNIARVMDGGTTPDGQPYFVMEYVAGVPIDKYCDNNRLTVDRRLELFRTVCRAVQYAHQTFVVHRDIKPDNILVSADGVPKLLDFGIAKLLDDQLVAPGDDGPTAASWLMTPDYASPEQVRGAAVTTATDVYSLGVLLHLLLTGVRPYRLTGSSRHQLSEELAHSSLPNLSDRVASEAASSLEPAAARGASPRQLSRRLRGDLDSIVRRALSHDLAVRYATVGQLAEEVDRHRRHYPVEARGPNVPYRAGRFVRRHRLALAVASVVMGLSIAGVGGIFWQASIAAEARARAERRFEDVRRLAHVFMFDVHDAIVNVPGTTQARALMVQTATEYLDGLAREAGGDLGLQRVLATAYVRVGDAQGHPTSANIGDTAGAKASYERAIEITGAVFRASPDDIEAERTRAQAHRRLADVLGWSGEVDEALTHGELSGRLFASVAGRPGAAPGDKFQAAVADLKLGDLLGNPNFPNLGRRSDADARYAQALAAFRALNASDPSDVPAQRYLGLILERIGTMREADGKWSEAAVNYLESYGIRRILADGAPYHADMQRDLAIAYEKLGNVQFFTNDVAAALSSYQGAHAQFERLARTDPSNAIAVRSVAISRENVARALVGLGRTREATNALRLALEAHNTLALRDSSNAQAKCDAARIAETLGDTAVKGAPAGLEPDRTACASWRDSLSARQSVRPTGVSCGADSELSRLNSKLVACR